MDTRSRSKKGVNHEGKTYSQCEDDDRYWGENWSSWHNCPGNETPEHIEWIRKTNPNQNKQWLEEMDKKYGSDANNFDF